MTGLVEQFAISVGWSIGRTNVIVEGTSDVAFLTRASDLHAQARGRPVLDADFSVVAAGRGDDGGVDGVNRRLNLVRGLADVDRDAEGRIRHRFVGLLDNDGAGRGALAIACRFDPRVEPYADLFVLRPVMPPFPIGRDKAMEVAAANIACAQLDWEIEDLCSERVLARFERENPGAVLSRVQCGDFVHREIDRSAKAELRRLFIETATIEDASGMIHLLKAMRGYLGVSVSFVQP